MIEGFTAWCGELNAFYARKKTYILFSQTKVKLSLGDLSGEGTPGLIPNPVVKLASADGTWGATPRESRSLPRDFFI
jgi:hypothetical protein